MIYNVTINDKVYEVEVEKGKANLLRTTDVVAAPAPVAAAPVKDDSEIIAVIAAAVAATGCSVEQIACVRRAGTPVWTNMARNEVQAVRHNMY